MLTLRHEPLVADLVRLEPLGPEHRQAVRQVFDSDEEAWSIMVGAGFGPHFEGWWAQALAGPSLCYAVVRPGDGAVVGVTGYHEMAPTHGRVEIGGTFFGPEARGGAINPAAKRLMLDHAFADGAVRVEFMTDALNARSRAALLKLGATQEGILRHHKTTWTGRVRDTVMFSILADEWPALRDRLDARLEALA